VVPPSLLLVSIVPQWNRRDYPIEAIPVATMSELSLKEGCIGSQGFANGAIVVQRKRLQGNGGCVSTESSSELRPGD